MRWQTGRRSRNVEDRRGIRISRRAKGGGIGVVVVALIALYFGVDPSIILNQGQQTSTSVATYSTKSSSSPAEDRLADFVSVVLGDTEDTWHELFRRMNQTYEEPKLVLFSGAVESACGYAQKARQILEEGDIDEALNAASSSGDDRLQKQARGYVTPDSFTHGSSAQRVYWFKKGFESGQLNTCNTFKSKKG